jgi:hypothetical protein
MGSCARFGLLPGARTGANGKARFYPSRFLQARANGLFQSFAPICPQMITLALAQSRDANALPASEDCAVNFSLTKNIL